MMGTLVLEVGFARHRLVADITCEHSVEYLLSQATVERIKQLGLQIYDVTRFLTSSMSLVFPPLLTLAIRPEKVIDWPNAPTTIGNEGFTW
jgi:hypothetical protein